jgi:hypothetical protein
MFLAALDVENDLISDRVLEDCCTQVQRFLDWCAIHRPHDVSLLQTGCLGGAMRFDIGQDHPGVVLETQRRCQNRSNVVRDDANAAAAHPAIRA